MATGTLEGRINTSSAHTIREVIGSVRYDFMETEGGDNLLIYSALDPLNYRLSIERTSFDSHAKERRDVLFLPLADGERNRKQFGEIIHRQTDSVVYFVKEVQNRRMVMRINAGSGQVMVDSVPLTVPQLEENFQHYQGETIKGKPDTYQTQYRGRVSLTDTKELNLRRFAIAKAILKEVSFS